jgi:hypothetical protein
MAADQKADQGMVGLDRGQMEEGKPKLEPIEDKIKDNLSSTECYHCGSDSWWQTSKGRQCNRCYRCF